ncbi:hypothetical protein CHU98_g5609 [Xylaria longipes]|nr:hypothetical protein CHU98_g5609 [Xylaria longipes]
MLKQIIHNILETHDGDPNSLEAGCQIAQDQIHERKILASAEHHNEIRLPVSKRLFAYAEASGHQLCTVAPLHTAISCPETLRWEPDDGLPMDSLKLTLIGCRQPLASHSQLSGGVSRSPLEQLLDFVLPCGRVTRQDLLGCSDDTLQRQRSRRRRWRCFKAIVGDVDNHPYKHRVTHSSPGRPRPCGPGAETRPMGSPLGHRPAVTRVAATRLSGVWIWTDVLTVLQDSFDKLAIMQSIDEI